MKSVPGFVPLIAFVQKMAIEEELDSAFRGTVDFGVPESRGKSRKGGQRLPAIKRAGVRAKAVPTSIRFLFCD